MRKDFLLSWLQMSYWLLASVEGLLIQHDRLKGRIVHVETLLQRGRWLWQNDNTDADGSYYFWIDKLDERDTYYTPRTQYQATACGGGDNPYLCFESISLPRRYLTAGFPAGATKYTVKLEYDTYTGDDDRYYWKVLCEDESLERCKFIPVRFESDGYMMVADDWGSIDGHDGGHYDATLGKDESEAWFRVLAPNPTDTYLNVYENSNCGDVDQTVTYTVTVGVTQTQSTTHTVTTSVSMEIGGAFKAFSASVGSSIEDSWQTAESSTFQASKTVSHELTLPAKKTIILTQLTGYYATEFKIGNDKYKINQSDAECGPQ